MCERQRGLTVLWAVLVVATTASATQGEQRKEHKVHNIVLYPDKQSWCKTTAIKQVVGMKGYLPVTIDNSVCVGACFSYSIPGSEPAEPGELIRPYCDSCQPLATSCYHVTLTRDEQDSGGSETPTPSSVTAQKRVQIIDECACLKCAGVSERVGGDCETGERRTSELPDELLSGTDAGGGGGDEVTDEDSDEEEETRGDVGSSLDALLESGGGSSGDTSDTEGHLRELLLARHRHWGLGQRPTVDGEEERLAPGPHGSLVLVPATATVDEADVRPAHEGTVISYHEPKHHHHHQHQHQQPPQPPSNHVDASEDD